jgi:hypothetical protein
MAGKEGDEADESGRVVLTRRALSGLLHHLYASREAKVATSSIFEALK